MHPYEKLKVILARLLLLSVTLTLGTYTRADNAQPSAIQDLKDQNPSDRISVESAATPLVQYLQGIQALHSQYRQETLSADQRTLQSVTGELWVDARQRFRIVADDPFEPILVSDGESFWNYDVGLDQITISDLNKDLGQVPVLLLSGHAGQISDVFVVERFELENDVGPVVSEQYLLRPRSADSLFESMMVRIDDKLPRTITVSDSLGQKTIIELSDVRINTKIDDDVFQLDIPAGIDVIDERH
ncbi:MAG: outer membrane lipoprotein carrier protein LolA [Gammaproteobacteria bacterium]|nr:outer membrane lipoprotein carrier protein LolA [Gammaproteobacteria bacterium]OUU10177.1 MAG: outer membrane lipoprotein carrier protein LolA [Gammaproteobacteria bacterium TMED34]